MWCTGWVMVRASDDRGSGGTIAVIIFFVIGVVVGGGLTFLGRSMAADARESVSWPMTDATVVSSELRIDRDSDGADSYAPEVTYRYEVRERNFTNTRIAFGPHNAADRGAVERTLARYPVGAVVPVSYDPDDLGRSVLEPGNEGAAFAIQLVGMGFVVAAVLVAAIALFLRLRRGPKTDLGVQSWGERPAGSDPFG